MLHEPDVTLTDFGLAIECALFACLLYWQNPASLVGKWFILFFCALALASLAGGTFHGFFSGSHKRLASFLWFLTLVAIGLSALAAWGIGAEMILSPSKKQIVMTGALLQFVTYLFFILFTKRSFGVAILNYLPSAFLLFSVFWILYWREKESKFFLGGIGFALIFLGSFFQQMRISVHPVYLTYNALYHVIEGIAFFVIFLSARNVIA